MGCVVGRHNDSSLSGYHLAEIYHQRYNFKLRVPVNGFESRTFHQLRKFMWRLWAKALGEKSGHMHVMTGNEVEMYQDEQGHVFYNVGTDGATLHHIHESNFKGYTKREQGAVADHPAIEFEAGVYEAWIQNQFNPYSKTFEKVLD